MTIPLSEYAVISDKLCLCYFGSKTNVIKFLYDIRPIIENKYPGIKLYYSFREEMLFCLDYVDNNDRIVSQCQLKTNRRQFAYLIDITLANLDDFFSEIGVKDMFYSIC